ncbi:unnamed protein product [Allacma fusca]|uniref:Uncharacterized protein n=1 Tax=Allacma fusca TaxID=39272 RepID=A0A8J2J855_9HEXA|nr:unnamed protein product [Allacma fusca]
MDKLQQSTNLTVSQEGGDDPSPGASQAAWGSLEPDHGSQPKHIRKVQLARFDPNKPPKAPKLAAAKSKLSPNDPEFWTTSDVFIVSGVVCNLQFRSND